MNYVWQARNVPGKSTVKALELTESLLNILEDFLDLKFDLPKIESVVISNKDTRELKLCLKSDEVDKLLG